jgi:hypothetical protein
MRTVVLSLFFIAGCASHPTPAPPSTAAVTPTTIKIEATEPEARAALSAAAVQLQVSDAIKNALKNGYHARIDGGERLYCRAETHLGSHIENQYCYTPEQLAKVFSLQGEIQDMLRQPLTCTGGYMCNGKLPGKQ